MCGLSLRSFSPLSIETIAKDEGEGYGIKKRILELDYGTRSHHPDYRSPPPDALNGNYGLKRWAVCSQVSMFRSLRSLR